MSYLEIKKNYLKIKQNVEFLSEKYKRETRIVAVSKTKSVEDILALYELGHRDFGENYVQEFLEKKKYFLNKGIEDVSWHFIGHLQSNKVKYIFNEVAFIHSVFTDSSLTQFLKQYKIQKNKIKQKIFIQVNIDTEDSKNGCLVSELESFKNKAHQCEAIELCGLMCIPDPVKNINGSSFLKMNELKERYFKSQKCELSMGMSEDYEYAIKNGATMIRLGSVLFGKRHS